MTPHILVPSSHFLTSSPFPDGESTTPDVDLLDFDEVDQIEREETPDAGHSEREEEPIVDDATNEIPDTEIVEPVEEDAAAGDR